MSIKNKVTVVMTTLNNFDFTMASLWALNKHYPGLQIILADGGSDPEIVSKYQIMPNKYFDKLDVKFIQVYKAPTEDCRNAASNLVETPYTLYMDNDTKVLSEDGIPWMLEVLEERSDAVQTGAYGLKVADWENRRGYVGTEFVDSMEIDASPCYFSLHKTEAYNKVGGMPKMPFYPGMPDREGEERSVTFTGDFTITTLYQENGFKCVTPKRRIPVLHWSQAARWKQPPRPVEDWWYKNCVHIRCNPLNDWEKLDSEYNRNS